MDILSHGLWAGVGAKLANKKTNLKLKPWLAGFWGVFPDLFAFGPTFLWLLYRQIVGEPVMFPRPENAEAMRESGVSMFGLSETLYNYSHSAVVFAFTIALIVGYNYIFRKKRGWASVVPWVMGGWLLHVLCDLPTHSYQFYPTPIFWPISGWKFDGFSWGTPWFIALNYTALVVIYTLIWRIKPDPRSK